MRVFENIPELVQPGDSIAECPEDPLEKKTAAHSSIFAWRIPWTEEPGRL